MAMDNDDIVAAIDRMTVAITTAILIAGEASDAHTRTVEDAIVVADRIVSLSTAIAFEQAERR